MILNYDNENLAQFGCFAFATDSYNMPERDVTTIDIPGRSGSLTRDNGRWKNITISYPAVIKEDFVNNATLLKNFLSGHTAGYYKLMDDVDTEHFRMARVMPVTFKTFPRMYGADFELSFDCKPQRFLCIGEQTKTFTANGSIVNPTTMDALPLIRVYGNGTLNIGGQSVTIANTAGNAYIDCELMECYWQATNLNDKMTGNFPKIASGESSVTFTGFSKIEIVPRWWEL